MTNNFAFNLKALRKSHNLTQSDLANKINVTRQAISSYEKGSVEPSFHVLYEVSKFFNCSIDELVFGENCKSSNSLLNSIFKALNSNFDFNFECESEKKQIYSIPKLISKLENKKSSLERKKLSLEKNVRKALKNIDLIETSIHDINKLISNLNDCSNDDNCKCEFSDELSPYENKIDNLDNDINAFDDEISSSDKINTNNIISINSKLESKREEQILDCTNIDFDSIEYTNIPYISDVSAGLPSLIYEDYRGECKVPDDYIYPNQNYFILRINGESMNKIYQYGELVLIRQCSYVHNGSMAVVSVNRDTATLKRYYYDAKTRTVSLEPLSDCEDFDIQYYNVDVDNIEIIGEVEYILKY